MHKLILLAGAAAMAAAMPAMAKPGQGGGKGAVKAQTQVKAKGSTRVVSGGKARTDSRASVRARTRTGASVNRTRDVDGDGIPDYRDRDIDRAAASHWVMQDGRWVRSSAHGRTTHPQGCPPGLANRTPPCVPPGQAKRMWQQGQVVPTSWRDYLTREALLGRLPPTWQGQIPAGDYRYIYNNNVVYVVDPRTRLIERVIDIIL